jgi:hypothetical protein
MRANEHTVKAAVSTGTIRKRNITFSFSRHEVHISPHHITTFFSRLNMRYVHADLQKKEVKDAVHT